MTDEKPPTKDNSNREMAIRTQALDMALRSNCGQAYNANNLPIHDHNKTIEGAKAFENFIRGEVAKSFIEGVSNNPSNPETKFSKESKKEGW